MAHGQQIVGDGVEFQIGLGRIDPGQPRVQLLDVEPAIPMRLLDQGGGAVTVVIGSPATGRRLFETHGGNGNAGPVQDLGQ